MGSRRGGARPHRGLAVLLMDYRGYGGNPGNPSEDGLAADADAAVEADGEILKATNPYPRVDFWRALWVGESLAALQARGGPAGVVLLVSPSTPSLRRRGSTPLSLAAGGHAVA